MLRTLAAAGALLLAAPALAQEAPMTREQASAFARLALKGVRKEYPKVRFVWGWSNTTFYHCPVVQLPPGTDGQSYHPYGTATCGV